MNEYNKGLIVASAIGIKAAIQQLSFYLAADRPAHHFVNEATYESAEIPAVFRQTEELGYQVARMDFTDYEARRLLNQTENITEILFKAEKEAPISVESQRAITGFRSILEDLVMTLERALKDE